MRQCSTLHTPRLILRPFERADARDVQRLAGDQAIADTTLNIPHPYEDGMAEEWIATHQPQFEAGEAAIFAIVLRATGELVGAIGLAVSRRFDRAELGYWIGRPYWNQGYCTEAGRAALWYGFTELELNRIHAYHLSRNPASGRVMEKLGMAREGLLRQHVKKWGKYEDIVEYGLVREDWMKSSEQPAAAGADKPLA
jgi:ribosomal-protein-alanine N-acetyltransferase